MHALSELLAGGLCDCKGKLPRYLLTPVTYIGVPHAISRFLPSCLLSTTDPCNSLFHHSPLLTISYRMTIINAGLDLLDPIEDEKTQRLGEHGTHDFLYAILRVDTDLTF
jgi:hypothetical protein